MSRALLARPPLIAAYTLAPARPSLARKWLKGRGLTGPQVHGAAAREPANLPTSERVDLCVVASRQAAAVLPGGRP